MINKELIHAISQEVEHLFSADTTDEKANEIIEAVLLSFGRMKALREKAQAEAKTKVEEAAARAKEDIKNIYGE